MKETSRMPSNADRMRLAYLCNVYPAVSHSFVRREIEALVNIGFDVVRFSIRPHRPDLKDPDDLRESAITEAVLGAGYAKLLFEAVGELACRPRLAIKALASAYRMSAAQPKQFVRHIAYLLEAAWLVKRFNQLGVTHLHAHFGTNPAAVALLVRALGGPPFSFTVHGPDEFDAPVALALREKIAASSFVVAISSFGRSQLMRWSAMDEWAKIKVIRCGLGDISFEKAAEPRPASREFCCIARLTAQKGLPLLIDACAKLDAEGDDFSVTVIGDGELKSELVAQITARRLGHRVTLAGSKSGADVRDYLLRSRALVLPSFAEGLPVVLMEAMALSRPVIATSIAGIPELVDGACGWLIPAGSVDALVLAMREVLQTSPQELAAKGRVGRARVCRMHSAERGAKLLARLIDA